MSGPLDWNYADNVIVTVADRLRAEVKGHDPKQLDIASGYLSVSVWGAVGDVLSRLKQVRLLLGKDWELKEQSAKDAEADIAAMVEAALRDETQPPRLPTPDDVEQVRKLIAFLERDGVEVKAWRGDKFLHAKAYLLDHSAGVGSANFTGAGLTSNRELVAWRQDYTVVKEYREWFERYWEDAASEPYTEELIEALRGTRFGGAEWKPYQLLIRVLADRYGLQTPPSLEQADFRLKWFQEEAVFRLIKLLSSQARGALLADAVGLGKTYMALGVIHHFLHERRETVKGRPVLLIIPASLRETWEGVLDRYNLHWAVEIVHVQALRSDYDVTDHTGADLVVIDEAHRLRGGSTWFKQTTRLLREMQAEGTDPRVLMLTATPVNTSLRDLTTLLRVLTKNQRNVWAPEIPDFEKHLRKVEAGDVDPYPLLDRSMVRRSRTDVVRAYEERRATDPGIEEIVLPNRRLGHESYDYASDGNQEALAAFEQELPQLFLAPYDLERFARPDDGGDINLAEEVESSSLAGLYMAGLLKRFESSVRAIRVSLDRLDRVLARFAEALQQDPPRLLDLGQRELRQLIEQEAEADEDREDAAPARFEELLEEAPLLENPDNYDLTAAAEATKRDRRRLKRLRQSLPAEADDGKIEALIDLLSRPMAGPRIGLARRRVLVFTQFRHTAEYVAERLQTASQTGDQLGPVELLHGGSSARKRDRVASTFDPDQLAELEAASEGREIPRILVSTDVLAEGHNLQLAEAVINYDLHWNPQVAVQRAGRVDRLNSPHDTVYLVSFLPGDDLEQMLGLVDRLNQRFRLYSHLGLADEPVTQLTADQIVGKSLEQLRRIYHDDEGVLDDIERTWSLGSTDYMRAPLEAFLREQAADALQDIPRGVQSIKTLPDSWPHGEGVFIAFLLSEDDEPETHWQFYPRRESGWGPPLTDDIEIFRAITSTPGTPRAELSQAHASEGPGIIDWDLLRNAASDLAATLTKERHTAAVTRGASERSAKVRARVYGLLGRTEPPNEVNELLDRLEQVRVEDYDADPRYKRFMDRLRAAEERAPYDVSDQGPDDAEELEDLSDLGLELFGPYEDTSDEDFATEIAAEDLQLSGYEVLVSPRFAHAPEVTQTVIEGTVE